MPTFDSGACLSSSKSAGLGTKLSTYLHRLQGLETISQSSPAQRTSLAAINNYDRLIEMKAVRCLAIKMSPCRRLHTLNRAILYLDWTILGFCGWFAMRFAGVRTLVILRNQVYKIAAACIVRCDQK
jgi:hypothetical protein